MHFEPEAYEARLQEKVEAVRLRFAAHLPAAAELRTYASPPAGFRQRARFVLRQFDGELRYALYSEGKPSVAVDSFPIASDAINDLMPRLLRGITSCAALSEGVAAVRFLSTQAGDMCVSLIYAAPLPAGWREAAEKLRQTERIPSLIGRAKGEVVALEREYVTERLALADGRALEYRQVEGYFSNPSAAMCEHTLNFLCEASAEAAAECAARHPARRRPNLLELYCGNGNHTVALGAHFARVLAVEIDSRLVEAAGLNLRTNGVENASILCVSSGKFCKRLLHDLRRDPRAGAAPSGGGGAAPPAAESVQDAWLREVRDGTPVVLVDPPRAGLDGETLRLVARFEHILYISCNPSSLLAELDASLGATHEVRRFAVFDHFPYTRHLECGVQLRRRGLVQQR
jgi:tRNA (uracil-5-)-methyltransferase